MAVTLKFVDSGASGADDGTSWADAWETIAQANNVAAGTTVLVKGGTTYTAEDGASDAVLNSSANGTITAPVIYQGDDASGGAGVGNPAYFTLDANSALAYACIPVAHTIYRHCKFTGGTSAGCYSTSQDFVSFYDCWAYSNSSTGVRTDNNSIAVGCKFFTTGQGLRMDNDVIVIGCEFYNNSTEDINTQYGVYVFNFFHEDQNVICINVDGDGGPMVFLGNTFDGMTDGIGIDFGHATQAMMPVIINNCFYDLTTGLASVTDWSDIVTFIRNNLFNSNTADADAQMNIGEDEQTDAPDFVDEDGTGTETGTDIDYRPDTGSPLIDNALDATNLRV